MKKVALGIVALALAAGFTTAQQQVRVGIAFDAGGKNDKSFNQSAYEGAQKAVKDLKVDYRDFEPSDPSQVGQGIRKFAEDGFDLVIGVGFANTSAIIATAKEFPDTKFAVIDDVPEGTNTTGAVFREHEGSFLVGYIAGKTTSTNVVGFVGGMDIPLIHKFDAGYTAGVKYACPKCTVISNYVGTTPAAWNDPAKAKEISAAQAAKGADIIYAAAGASGSGVQTYVKDSKCVNSAKLPTGIKLNPMNVAIKSLAKPADYKAKCVGANDRPMFFIGVDANQNYIGDSDNNPKTLNYGLTSMLKRVDTAVYQIIKDTVDGKGWTAGAREFGLDNNGVGYAIDAYNKSLVSSTTIKKLEALKADIISGKIKVPSK